MKLPGSFLTSRFSTITAVLLMASVCGAHAAMIAYDGFNSYATGALSGGNGGTGWSNAYTVNSGTVNVVSGGLSYSGGSISVGGGSQSVAIQGASNNNSLINRQFPAQAEGTDIWFSFLFSPTPGADTNDFVQFWIGSGSGVNGSGATLYSSGFLTNRLTSVSGITATGGNTIGSTSGSTYFLVGRFSTDGTSVSATNYDRIELWVNPTSTAVFSGPADWTTDLNTGFVTGVSWFGVRTANLDSGDNYRFDELRIGTDALSVIPEPGAGLFLLGGFAALFLARRRRN